VLLLGEIARNGFLNVIYLVNPAMISRHVSLSGMICEETLQTKHRYFLIFRLDLIT
jgi:hypothetical protein